MITLKESLRKSKDEIEGFESKFNQSKQLETELVASNKKLESELNILQNKLLSSENNIDELIYFKKITEI